MQNLYIKLASQNLKYRNKEYLLFFLTSFFTIILLYSVFSLIYSDVLFQLSENMPKIITSIYILVFITIIASCFIFTYIINFILNCRKNEFAIYLLLGMKQKQISFIFILENIFLGFVSLVLGVLIGSIFSGLIIKAIYLLFNKEINILFNFSIQAVIMTFLLMLLIFIISISKSIISIIKSNLVDLIEDENKTEFSKIKNKNNNKKSILILKFIISLLFFILGSLILYIGLQQSSNLAILYICISAILNIIAIYQFHYSIFSFITLRLEKNEKWKYNKENLFLFGQIKNNFNLYRKRISLISIMLTFSSVILLVGLIFSISHKENINAQYPFDVAIMFDKKIKNFDDVIKFVEQKYEVKDNVMFYLYESDNYEVPFLKLSDYNRLRQQLNLDEKKLKENEFIVHCDWFLKENVENIFNKNNSIIIGNNEIYANKNNIFTENIEQYRFTGEKGYVVVVPDSYIEFLVPIKSRLAINLNGEEKEELKEELNTFIRKDWEVPFEEELTKDEKIGLYISVREWGINNSLSGFVSIAILCIYMCIIFMIFSLTFISFEQLSSVLNSRKSYNTIDNIGVSLIKQKLLLKKEVINIFISSGIFPIVYTIITTILAYIVYKNYLLSPNIIPYSFLITISVFLIIFISYFIITIKISKKIIFTN